MLSLSQSWHLCVSDSGEWWFRGMVLLLMTFRLSFSSLYSLTSMSAFNTPDSSIPLWISEKHFPSHFRNSQSSSHFKSRPPSSYWVFLRDLRNLRAKLKVKKVIKNRLDVFLLQWALETPRLGQSSCSLDGTSCLTISNLPWFMDLTFQVSMQYCSLLHRTSVPSPVTSTTGCCFCFGSISSFFL